MLREMDAAEAREQLESLGYRAWMDFVAWESGNCRFWANEEGDVVAYCRFDDHDANGIAFFETRDRGQGVGSQIISALKAEMPDLYISGDIDNKNCQRFWVRMGFDVADAETVR